MNADENAELMGSGEGEASAATAAVTTTTTVTDYDYTYNGGQLTGEVITTTVDGTITNTETLYYSYDAGGTPVSVKYNNTLYFYVTNLQGDVVAIMNSSGTVVVEYTYDAWGFIRNTTGTMAETLGKANALRYRGYVYDPETALYYLQSRYYNPGTGRFINADILVSTGQGLIGNNMFAYCNNNPVVRVDESGTAAKSCISADGRIADSPWREHSPSGGGREYVKYTSGSNYYGEVSDKFYTVKFLRAAGNGVRIGAKYLWNAYSYGYNMLQYSQMQETKLMVDFVISIYDKIVETEVVAIGKVTYHSVQAAREGGKALAYLLAPIPTPIDEALGVGHAIKGGYHLFMSLWEVFR